MDNDKQRQEVSLIGRILSMEALLMLMGTISLVYGIIQGELMNIFWGVVIIPGVLILIRVRRKDWKKHWEELQQGQRAPEAGRTRIPPPDDTKKD